MKRGGEGGGGGVGGLNCVETVFFFANKRGKNARRLAASRDWK